MRRSVRYTAGLLIAAGASLAFAGPASAATTGGVPNWYAPVTYNAPAQFLGQAAFSGQQVANNFGNGQFGTSNWNTGGTAVASNGTGQYAGQVAGGVYNW